MKKVNIINVFLIFTYILNMYSCSTRENQEIDEIIDKYTSHQSSEITYFESFDWLDTENNYNFDSSIDNVNDIVNLIDPLYIPHDNRIYLKMKRDNNSVWAYIDLNSGNLFYLCPDPLCAHTEESGCKYLNIESTLIFDPSDDNTVYAVKRMTVNGALYDLICEINLRENTIETIYGASTNSTYDMYNLRFIINDNLYFQVNRSTREKDESGHVIKNNEVYYMTLDLNTHEASKLENKYVSLEHGVIFWAGNGYILFVDEYNRRVFVTDYNFENEILLYEYAENYSINRLCIDKSSGELYFLIYTTNMNEGADEDETEGYIVYIGNDLKAKRVDMPSERIYDFRLTENYIYYSIYSPKQYGTTPVDTTCVSKSGNKIYRINRDISANDGVSEPQLIFDGRDDIFFSADYIVCGDYIYIYYVKLMDEGGMAWFRWIGTTARVNFVDGTIKWLT